MLLAGGDEYGCRALLPAPLSRPRGSPLLALAGAAFVASLLDCGGGGKPMTNVMQFMESHYRDLEERSDRLAGGAAKGAFFEADFNAIADRAGRIAALSEEPSYAGYRSAPDFQGWRAQLKARALDLEQAARRRDGAAVEAGFAEVTGVMTACHRRYPLSPRQAAPRKR